jgi:hypothetical protein
MVLPMSSMAHKVTLCASPGRTLSALTVPDLVREAAGGSAWSLGGVRHAGFTRAEGRPRRMSREHG